MHAAILSVLTGDPDVEELSSRLGSGLPAAEIEATTYLDGRTIHHGTLAGRIEEDTRVPIVGDRAILEETETQDRKVSADVYVDLDTGWAGVSSGDGQELLSNYVLTEAGVVPESAEIDLVGFAEHLPDGVETNGIVYSQSIEDGHRRDAAGADWHQDARPSGIPSEGLSALAVTYSWDGVLADAMLAASGYVAIYRPWNVDTFARWVADEVEPFLSIARDDQGTLGGGSA